jgi:DUF4097 and DUF4098 domain-containing protein YvlB
MTMSSRAHVLTLGLALLLATTPALASEDISKVNGSIEAQAGQVYGDLDTVNGSIRIHAGAQAREASTVNGSITVDAKAQVGSLDTVNGAIRVGTDVRISGDVDTVNGSIFIDSGSVVSGDVETVNGAIGLVRTQLGGSVETVNGDITIGVGSHVKGGIKVQRPGGWFNTSSKRKPRVVIGPQAVVEGSLVFEREVQLYVHRSARTGTIRGAQAISFDTDTAPRD